MSEDMCLKIKGKISSHKTYIDKVSPQYEYYYGYVSSGHYTGKISSCKSYTDVASPQDELVNVF